MIFVQAKCKRALIFRVVIHFLMMASLLACSQRSGDGVYRPLENERFLPQSNVDIEIPGLSSCTYSKDRQLRLNSSQPVTVIVHGCFSSSGRFRSLADVFAFHGQQTVCFDYDDRASLDKSASELRMAIEALAKALPESGISIIGHSQGGLVARRSLIKEHVTPISLMDTNIHLTTISSPFGGIESSSHCGLKWLKWASLGLVNPLCQLITGSKYKEIPPGSDFMENPGQLAEQISQHLKIMTDETNSCRRFNEKGSCVEDDYVFSLGEQRQLSIDQEDRLNEYLVRAGHVEIVGDELIAPEKLIAILQLKGILNKTPPHLEDEFALLLDTLYH